MNAVAPGPIDTPLLDKAQPERIEELMKVVYTRRKGRPDEVAEAIRWLALDAPAIINGAMLDITDGSVPALSSGLRTVINFCAPRQQLRIADSSRPRGERVGRAAPAQLLDVANSGASVRSVASFLNSSASVAPLAAATSGGNSSIAPYWSHQPRGAHRADAGDAGIAVGGVADEREVVGE